MTTLSHVTTGDLTDGPPVVLLHALGSSVKTWKAFAAKLPRASISLDLRGHGASPRPGDYTFTTMADDVLAFLDEHGYATVDIVGHSLGGAVAQHLAMRAPGRVRRMVVEDICPPPHEPVPLPEVPDEPDGPIDFDWAVVKAIRHLVRTPDPAWWAGLTTITADTLWLAGGSPSHIDQARLRHAAASMPSARVVEIPVGHRIHSEAPDKFNDAVIPFLTAR